MLNIDRLNDVMNGKLGGRGCGRTTAMIVRTLTEAELAGIKEIVVFATHNCHSHNLMEQVMFIALDMGYPTVRRVGGANVLKIGLDAENPSEVMTLQFASVCNRRRVLLGRNPDGIIEMTDHATINPQRSPDAVDAMSYAYSPQQLINPRFLNAKHEYEEQYRREFQCEWVGDISNRKTEEKGR
jgi:hypothetical protein